MFPGSAPQQPGMPVHLQIEVEIFLYHTFQILKDIIFFTIKFICLQISTPGQLWTFYTRVLIWCISGFLKTSSSWLHDNKELLHLRIKLRIIVETPIKNMRSTVHPAVNDSNFKFPPFWNKQRPPKWCQLVFLSIRMTCKFHTLIFAVIPNFKVQHFSSFWKTAYLEFSWGSWQIFHEFVVGHADMASLKDVTYHFLVCKQFFRVPIFNFRHSISWNCKVFCVEPELETHNCNGLWLFNNVLQTPSVVLRCKSSCPWQGKKGFRSTFRHLRRYCHLHVLLERFSGIFFGRPLTNRTQLLTKVSGSIFLQRKIRKLEIWISFSALRSHERLKNNIYLHYFRFFHLCSVQNVFHFF